MSLEIPGSSDAIRDLARLTGQAGANAIRTEGVVGIEARHAAEAGAYATELILVALKGFGLRVEDIPLSSAGERLDRLQADAGITETLDRLRREAASRVTLNG